MEDLSNLGNLGNPLAHSTGIVCEECGDELFVPLVILRKIPKLVVGSNKDEVIPLQATYMCAKCGHINKEFLPDEVTEGTEEKNEEPKPSIILP